MLAVYEKGRLSCISRAANCGDRYGGPRAVTKERPVTAEVMGLRHAVERAVVRTIRRARRGERCLRSGEKSGRLS